MSLFTINDLQICERTLNIICNFVEMLHQVPHKLKKQCVKYIVMHFQSYWQNSQFKECINNLPTGVIVSVIDFAENYTFKVQNEVQSMHWYNDQCIILVLICYWRQDGELHKKSIFYISDDKKHDTLFAQHCFKLHHANLLSLGFSFNRH